MKTLLLFAAAITVILSACSKEPAPTAQPIPQPSPQAVPGPVAPVGELTTQDKEKALEAAKAAAQAAGKRE